MITYANYTDFTLVYSFEFVSQTAIESYWLQYGALRVNEVFGCKYTLPFSSNNYTAKDLSIHYAALGILERTLNQEDTGELKSSIMERITNVTCGGCFMISTSGEIIDGKENALSYVNATNQNYNPTFSMLPAEDQVVDPDYIEDTVQDRLSNRTLWGY